MTAAAADPAVPAGVVRPFGSRVVRQEWAAQAVAPMVDAAGLTKRGRRPRVPAAAYDDSPPALYIYRMRTEAGDHTGVVADVRLDAFAHRDVRGHESVEPSRVDALVQYYADHPARSEPVALLHAQPRDARSLVEDVCRGRPLIEFVAADGVQHAVWRVTGDHEAVGLAAALSHGLHYIADGHHRVAARLRAWERAGRPADAGVLCVVFPMDGLTMSAFHRRVSGPVDAAGLLDAAAAHFVVREVADVSGTTGIGLYVAGCWYDLQLGAARADGSDGLDASVLQAHLLGPVLDVSGPGHPRLDVLPDHLPLDRPTATCDDDGGALFVLRPPSLGTLTRIADLGEEMPPKTTYFAPKPYAGIFLV